MKSPNFFLEKLHFVRYFIINMRFLYTFAYEKQEKAAVLSKTAAFAEILTSCL